MHAAESKEQLCSVAYIMLPTFCILLIKEKTENNYFIFEKYKESLYISDAVYVEEEFCKLARI